MADTFIPLSIPDLRGRELEYLTDCIESGWVSSVGSYVTRFEELVASLAGRKHAVAVVNGSAALYVSLMLLGVRPGDEVIVSDLTFIASANAIRAAGAIPVLVDCEPESAQINVGQVDDFLTNRCRPVGGKLVDSATGNRVAAIMPVHILGHAVDMDRLCATAARFGVPIVEDAAEAIGVTISSRAAGSFGEIACFSFNGNKIVTCGGGGIIATDDPEIARRARHITTQAKADRKEYIHDELGYNFRLTNLQAAVGCAQIERLGEIRLLKAAIAKSYCERLEGVPGVSFIKPYAFVGSTYWLNTIRINPKQFGRSSRMLMDDLSMAGIESRPLWQPMHMSAVHGGASSVVPYPCDNAAALFEECLSLPSSSSLASDDVTRVIDAIAAPQKESSGIIRP